MTAPRIETPEAAALREYADVLRALTHSEPNGLLAAATKLNAQSAEIERLRDLERVLLSAARCAGRGEDDTDEEWSDNAPYWIGRMVARAENDRAEIERLRAALIGLVRINEEHNEACARVIGVPFDWKDSYLDAAREALKDTP